MKRIFIDGSAGTTGLRIRERLAGRADIEVVALPEELRKDASARRAALNGCDVAMLCLPDAAAVEAAAMVENPEVVVIDTSTAHRVADGWEYGFPELAGRRESIAKAKRIANPGCHASGFIALVEPLVRAGVIAPSARLSSFSLTGYSGGGKKMIAEYEKNHLTTQPPACAKATAGKPNHLTTQPPNNLTYLGGRQYALGQAHKHLPEMVKVCGLDFAPCFSPVVVPHFSGMEVTVFLHGVDPSAVREVYCAAYGVGSGMVKFAEDPSEGGFLSSAALSGRDDMEVSVFGTAERAILVSRFDNLGKGASGAAIQNLNLVLGACEGEGLVRG